MRLKRILAVFAFVSNNKGRGGGGGNELIQAKPINLEEYPQVLLNKFLKDTESKYVIL